MTNYIVILSEQELSYVSRAATYPHTGWHEDDPLVAPLMPKLNAAIPEDEAVERMAKALAPKSSLSWHEKFGGLSVPCYCPDTQTGHSDRCPQHGDGLAKWFDRFRRQARAALAALNGDTTDA